jgi:hypothetical protein
MKSVKPPLPVKSWSAGALACDAQSFLICGSSAVGLYLSPFQITGIDVISGKVLPLNFGRSLAILAFLALA